MNDDPILTALAERNPVREIPPYDTAGEARLRDLLSTFRTAPRSRMRRPAWTVATVGGGLVVAVVAGVVIAQPGPTTAPHPSAQHPPRPNVTSSPATRFPVADGTTPVGLILDRSTTALNEASDFILQGNETTYGPQGQPSGSVFWQDEGLPANFRTQESDNAGQLLLDITELTQNGTGTSRTVDYQRREYTELTGPATAHRTGKNQAQVIAGNLRTGNDKVLGTSVVDGHMALHLSNDEPGMNREIWVDPTTYLPIRMTAHGTWGSYVMNYVWIPRTDQNLRATFLPPVPAGFTKVSRFGVH